jgi:hypothetical protein
MGKGDHYLENYGFTITPLARPYSSINDVRRSLGMSHALPFFAVVEKKPSVVAVKVLLNELADIAEWLGAKRWEINCAKDEPFSVCFYVDEGQTGYSIEVLENGYLTKDAAGTVSVYTEPEFLVNFERADESFPAVFNRIFNGGLLTPEEAKARIRRDIAYGRV